MSVHKLALSQPVQWSEGMLLSPQHFQQNDKYWGQQLCAAMATMQPHFYGINTLEIDHSELSSGTLLIKSVSGVLPDGLLFNYPLDAQAKALKRNIEADFKNLPEKQKLLQVYLQVPKRGAAAAKTDSPQQRFISLDPEETVDENTGQGSAEVGRLVPNLSLSVSEPNSTFTYIRIMTIGKNADGMYKIERDYPAMLNIAAFSNFAELCLQRRVRKLRDSLRERTRQLGKVLQAEKSNTDGAQRRRYSHIISQLVKALPVLDIYQDSPDVHPYSLYTSLAVFLGQICSINPKGVLPPIISGYKHANSYEGFDKILSLLEDTVAKFQLGYSSMVFDKDENGVFTLLMNAKWQGRAMYIEARMNSSSDSKHLQNWFANAIIASEDTQLRNTLEASRTIGAHREPVNEVKNINLFSSKDSVLYKVTNLAIKMNSEHADVIRYGEKLCIYYTGSKITPDSLVLHIANPAAVASDHS